MVVLDDLYPTRAALIRAAARQLGRLERAQVYTIAEFTADRTLRGLTRPTNRITAALIALRCRSSEGLRELLGGATLTGGASGGGGR